MTQRTVRTGSRIARIFFALGILVPTLNASVQAQEPDQPRPLPRALGIYPGVLAPGPFNAITDVVGVRVGHETVLEGDIRSGVTAIIPHSENVFQSKVPAAIVVGNGFGKLAGVTQVRELGELETPILLTNTLAVPTGVSALMEWTLLQDGNEEVRSVNPVVGETNDGYLNDIRARALTEAHMVAAIEAAESGSVTQGSVGAGTGTIAFGWKGGIGTSSRALPENLGGYTVGVLVQTNFGGALSILGVPVGIELGQYFLKGALDNGDGDGSIMIVVATDAPLDSRNLERLATRSLVGLARSGGAMTNGSGDYVIAFSTHPDVLRTPQRRGEVHHIASLPNDNMSPLFQAVAEATEEAIYNSLFQSGSMTGAEGRVIPGLPVERVLELIREAGMLREIR